MYFAIILAFGVWMWGGWVSFNTKPAWKWLIRLISVGVVIGGGVLLLAGPGHEVIDWQEYDGGAIDAAKEEGRPVLIKFTADWCVSCQVADVRVFSRKEIADLVTEKNVLAVKADTTVQNYPATIALKDIYGETGGIPVTIIFIPGQDEPVRLRGSSFADELEQLLKGLP